MVGWKNETKSRTGVKIPYRKVESSIPALAMAKDCHEYSSYLWCTKNIDHGQKVFGVFPKTQQNLHLYLQTNVFIQADHIFVDFNFFFPLSCKLILSNWFYHFIIDHHFSDWFYHLIKLIDFIIFLQIDFIIVELYESPLLIEQSDYRWIYIFSVWIF